MPFKRKMPRKKKEDVRKNEQPKVPLRKALLDALPGSVDTSSKIMFEDSWGECRDVDIPHTGRSLFWYFYNNRDEKMPLSNPWKLELAKVIVPNVFIDVELIEVLTRNYKKKKPKQSGELTKTLFWSTQDHALKNALA